LEIEKIIGLASLLLTVAAVLIIMNATLPRFAVFSSHIASRSFPVFTLQYWWLFALVIAVAVLAFTIWIKKEE